MHTRRKNLINYLSIMYSMFHYHGAIMLLIYLPKSDHLFVLKTKLYYIF